MKTYFIKMFEPGLNGKYITTLSDVSFSGFRKQINSGLGELKFDYAKKFDDFDEGYLIKFNNKVELWVADVDTGTDGKLIYSGYISSYNPYIDGNSEGVEVTCVGYITKLATSILKNGSQIELKTDTAGGVTTGDTASACAIDRIVRAVINRYQAEANNPVVNYELADIEGSPNVATYTFNGKYYLDVLKKCIEFSPAGWWFYVGADNLLKFKAKYSQPIHTFIFGKHFKSVKVVKNIDNLVNNVLFSSGNNPDQQILKLYADTTSTNDYDDRWEILSDNRVSVTDTADNFGESELADKKDPDVRTVVEILDNNGTETGYDIESIEVGDTCRFLGFNDITSQTFNDNMQIVSIDYSPDSAIIEVERLAPNIARDTDKNKKKIEESESTGRAKNYDIDSDRWRNIGDPGEPAFVNSWVNYDSSIVSTVAYMKDSLGFVHLKGLLKDGTATNNTPIFTLPVGYRPLKMQHISNMSYGTAGYSPDSFIRIGDNGVIDIFNARNSWLSIDNITFKAEQ